jgi:hypothetical protein
MKAIALGYVALIGLGLSGCCKGEDSSKTAPAPSATTPTTKTETPTKPTTTATATATAANANAIPDIPDGVSKPPTVAEWSAASQINTVGANSEAKDCFMKLVREWLKVNCSGKIVAVEEKDGFGKQDVDHFESVKLGTSADYVIRLRKGISIKAKIRRESDSAALFVNWPGGAPKPTIIALQAAPK